MIGGEKRGRAEWNSEQTAPASAARDSPGDVAGRNVVHFNMGLHGWQQGRIKEGTFEPLTTAHVQVIRDTAPRTRVIWASSTPVTVKGKPTELDPAINPVIVEHNRMAANVMRQMNVPMNDFYSLLAPRLELARGDQFHWRGGKPTQFWRRR